MDRLDSAIGLLVLNCNGKKWLSPLFESVQNDGYGNVRIYLVDNLSTDGSVESTLANHPEVTVIRMPRNLGFCMAYNMAMPFAFADGCEWVIWANNDVLLEPGCLSGLIKAVQDDPDIGVAGPAFLSWDSDEPNYYMKGKCPELIPAMKARSAVPVDVDWVEGSFLMVRRSIVEEIGSLDPRFFIFWEEAEFCRRVRYAGKRVVLVPSARVRHYGGAFSEGRRDRKREWLHSRNYYIYTLTNPEFSFTRNLLYSFYLFLVNAKAALKKSPDHVLLEARALGAVLLSAGVWYRKRSNDRRGIPPLLLDEQFRGVCPEVLFSPQHEAAVAK